MGDPLEDRNRKFQKSDFFSEQQKRQEFSVQLRKKKRLEKLITNRFKETLIEMDYGPTDSCEEEIIDEFDPIKEDYVSLIKSFKSVDQSVLLRHLNTLVQITTKEDEIRLILVNSGIIEALERYTSNNYPLDIRTTSLWVFSNICASNNPETIKLFIENPLVNCLFKYLSEDSEEIIEHTLMCLFNLACDNANYCKTMIDKGLIDHLKPITSKFFNETILGAISWGLSNLTHFEQLIDEEKSTIIIQVCANFFNFPSTELQCKVILVLSRLIRNDNKKVDLLITSPVFEKCFEFITNADYHKALVILGSNICSGTYSHTQKVLDKGILDLLWTYLDTNDEELLYTIYFSIQNIAAGTVSQLKQLSSHVVFYSSLNGLMSPNPRIKTEASYIVRNYLKHSSEDMKVKFLTDQFIQAIIQAMEYKEPEFITNLLTVFEEYLKVKGHQEFYLKNYDAVVEKLETHQNATVYEKCLQILQSSI